MSPSRLALAFMLGLLSACGPAPERSDPADAAAAAPAVDVVELDVAEAQARMQRGELSARQLAQAYLDRIAAIDDDGPRLNAVIALLPDVLEQADRLDAERAAGSVRGPLHGIPVLVKDNIDVAGVANSAGSLALADNLPADDAFLVRRLREAGAVVLGKANLSEWANFRSNRSVSGWSSLGGQVRNPYVLDRSPCGSSAGTGAGIAASLATVGVGTETDGSIICPSAVNGLVGLKPTVGLVSRDGIIPISASQDTAGPMGRRVADVAALLQAMAAADPAEAAAWPLPPEGVPDYLAAARDGDLKGRRLGVLRQATGYHAGTDAVFEAALVRLREAGAELVDVQVPTWRQWSPHEFEVLLHEFKAGLDAYLAGRPADTGSLDALVRWNQAHAGEAMPLFGQELFEQALARGDLSAPAYLAARDAARRLARDEGLLAALDGQSLDALVAPATAPAWPIDPVLGDRFLGSGYGMAAVAGTPSLTVPMGEVSGLPVGLVLLGRPGDEAGLIGLGAAFERTGPARKPPGFRPTLVP